MEFIDNGVSECARSLIPNSLCAVDKTMEETFMNFAKGSGVLIGIFEQYTVREKYPYSELFWSVFSRIRTE